MFWAKTNSLPRDNTGIERAPMRCNSARPAGSSRILIDSNSIPRIERNSLSLRQLVQPGCQNAFSRTVSAMSYSSSCRGSPYAFQRSRVNPRRPMGAPTGLPLSPLLREDRPQAVISRRRRAMALQVRRVVTGHDAEGRAIVQIDEVSQNLRSARPGATACVVWTSQGFPIDNTGKADEGLRESGTTLDNGTDFSILHLEP